MQILDGLLELLQLLQTSGKLVFALIYLFQEKRSILRLVSTY